MRGRELFYNIQEKGTFSESEASDIIHRISSALAHMHDIGVAHRDLKPGTTTLLSILRKIRLIVSFLPQKTLCLAMHPRTLTPLN
jgi:serine/threonine protein kinase